MGERTIAEIIGWRGRTIETDGSSGGFVQSDGRFSWHEPTPTVDDLLVWLACDMFFEVDLIVAYGFVSVEFKDTDSGLDGDTFDGDTLLEALEAAVCAVDSQSSLAQAPVPAGGGVEAHRDLSRGATSPGVQL